MLLCPRYGHIHQVWVITELSYLVVNDTQNDRIFFTTLILMYGGGLYWWQLPIELINLIVVRCNDTYFFWIIKMRQYFLLYYINLTLVVMVSTMMSRNCFDSHHHVLFIMILRHNEKVSSIETLIAEVDDGWMATIMFPQQCLLNTRQDCTNRLQETILSTVVTLLDLEFIEDTIKL